MLTGKKLLLPAVALALASIVAVVAVVAASSGGSDDSSGRESVTAGDQGKIAGDGGGLAMCAEDVPDCQDMIVNPGGDDSDSHASNPDEPVTSGPITSIDDIDPNECNMVHNIEVCRQQATDASVRALADRLGVQPQDIAVESAEIAEWPDACLGVAQPDTACAQVITPGWRILLDHAGTAYEYHTDADGGQALLAE